MTKALELKRKIFEAPGFSADVRLGADELAVFRSAIAEQWLSVISARHPDLAPRFQEAGLPNYHTLSHLIDHEKLWPKKNRCLPARSCEQIKALPFLQILKQEFGEFRLSDVNYDDVHEAGREEIYWRLVRPDAPDDVGSIHADKWFHGFIPPDKKVLPPGSTTVKIWIPIYSIAGKNGLMIVPNSHLREWRYRGVPGRGGIKPEIDEDVEALGVQLMLTDPGDLLIFNEATLHGGAVNRGGQTRVSAEITMLFRGG
jgi:Phytanoyl-CoA dioxygenase (PhyH)